MTQRKLATTAVISDIKKINGADKICAYKVRGWWVVDQIDKYSVGDVVIFIEVDSWIPHDIAPFLSKGNKPREYLGVVGEKLNTVKLKGQISQGLILNVKALEGKNINTNVIDQDVSKSLGIIKWEAYCPLCLNGNAKGIFPWFLKKTDQERIQNLWSKYKEEYNDVEFEVSLKLDGTSCTVYLNQGEFGVCSRNLELKDGDNTYWKVAKDNQLEQTLRSYGKNIAISGELIGTGIQKNPEKINGHEFKIFDIYDIDEGRYLTSECRFDLINNLLSQQGKALSVCPVLGEDLKFYNSPSKTFKLSQFDTLEELLAFADGPSERSDCREGFVFKSTKYIDGGIVSFKVISNEFLLKTK